MAFDSQNLANAFAELRADFRAAKSSRFAPRLTGVDSFGSGADYHYRHEREYLHMMERARDYERNDMIVASGLNRLVANVFPETFAPDPKTGSAELDKRLKDRWMRYASDPDQVHSEGEFDWYQLERLAFRSVVRDGDCFVLPLKTGAIQFVEGHRPRTPTGTKRNVVHGILLDDNAKRQQVWFTREDVGLSQTISRVRDIRPVDFRDADGNRQVLQLYFPKRFSQRRGVGAMAPSMDTIGQHDDLQFTTLVKAQMAALLVMVEELNEAAGAGIKGPGLSGPPSAAGIAETSVSGIPQLGAGLHYKTRNKLTAFAPNIPNEEFFAHSMLLLTFIAVNLDLPVQALLLDPSRTNFSSWRGALDQARLRFREMQADICNQLHNPIWRWKVRQWIESDATLAALVVDGVDPFSVNWKKPRQPYIDPLKDSQADALQADKFLNSMTRIHGARGQDWDEVAVEIVRDKVLLIREAIQSADLLNSEFPAAGVTWREILGPGLTIPLQPFNAGEPAAGVQ